MSLPGAVSHPKHNPRQGPARTIGVSVPRSAAAVTPDGTLSWYSRHDDGEERAQFVARCSIELAARSGVTAIGDGALELLRVADHDPTTLQHALGVCRSLLRDDPTSESVEAAIRLLERVTVFLGVRPKDCDARTRALR